MKEHIYFLMIFLIIALICATLYWIGNYIEYNLLGLLFRFSHQPQIMFCTQLIYTMLKMANLNYFEKDTTHVRLTDFVELNYHRKLEFVREIVLCETNLSSGEDTDGQTNS